MTREEIEKRLRLKCFGEYNAEIDFLLSELDRVEQKVKELEDELSQANIKYQIVERASLDGDNRIKELKARLKKLEEAVDRHRNQWMFEVGIIMSNYYSKRDEELYRIRDEIKDGS